MKKKKLEKTRKKSYKKAQNSEIIGEPGSGSDNLRSRFWLTTSITIATEYITGATATKWRRPGTIGT